MDNEHIKREHGETMKSTPESESDELNLDKRGNYESKMSTNVPTIPLNEDIEVDIGGEGFKRIPTPWKPILKPRRKRIIKDCLAMVIDANKIMLADVLKSLN